MQSSPRAARDSELRQRKQPSPTGKSPKTEVVQRLWPVLSAAKRAQTKPADTNANALLAFPSEAISRPEPPPLQTPRNASRPRPPTPSPTLIRWMLIVGGVVVVAGIGAFAVQRYPILKMMASEPRPGNLTINTRPDRLGSAHRRRRAAARRR